MRKKTSLGRAPFPDLHLRGTWTGPRYNSKEFETSGAVCSVGTEAVPGAGEMGNLVEMSFSPDSSKNGWPWRSRGVSAWSAMVVTSYNWIPALRCKNYIKGGLSSWVSLTVFSSTQPPGASGNTTLPSASVTAEQAPGQCCFTIMTRQDSLSCLEAGEWTWNIPPTVNPKEANSRERPFLRRALHTETETPGNRSHTWVSLTTLFYKWAPLRSTIILCHPPKSRANVAPFRKIRREWAPDVGAGLLWNPVLVHWV